MPLDPGWKLGPYDVVGSLGAGGMGEVYRGRDARLKRDVALKILPSTFAAGPERLARFEREAQALAAIFHLESANLMSVAVETSNGFNFKPAVRLFERSASYARSEQPPSYDVAADGRFVMVKSDAAADIPISVIFNWRELLARSAATH